MAHELHCGVEKEENTMHNIPAMRTPADKTRSHIQYGLDNVVALASSICHIDGKKGELVYRGYDIQDLCQHTSFEEVAFLLWNGTLPDRTQLATLHAFLCAERTLPPMVLDILRLTPEDANPMAVLRTSVSALAHFDAEADDMAPDANYRKAVRLTARIPTIIAAFDRIRKGRDPITPLSTGSTAHNFLYMLNGEGPGPSAEKTFDMALVLHAEHGLNASTFAGRVISATLSDIYSAVTGAIGALKGPLHGGANIRVMQMLLEIDQTGQNPAKYIRTRLAKKKRIMGFGHRVYKTMDPRGTVLRDMVDALGAERNATQWATRCSDIAHLMATEKNIYPNVDFYSAPVYYMLGIDPDLYTALFVMSRITGWTAHLLEQWQDNRLIRPRAEYTGPRNLSVRPLVRR